MLKDRFKAGLGMLVLGVAFATSGCSSPEDKQVRAIRDDYRAGNIEATYEATSKVLADPDALDEQRRQEVAEIHKRAEEKLVEYYASAAAVRMASGDLENGLKVYEEALMRLPGLAADIQANETAMRAYVSKGDLLSARRAANNVIQHAPDEETRANAQEFLQKVDELEEARAVVKQLRPIVDGVSAATGTAFNEMPSMSCISPEIDKSLSDDTRAQLVKYFTSLDQERRLTYEIGQLLPGQTL